jgi:RNA polymerase sigma-70 factor (ECF subfamily)
MEIAVTGSRDDDELAALVGEVRRGDDAAFDTLARRLRDRVRAWARRLVGDNDEAEDVAQLVLVRMHERLDEFEGRSRFASWLYRITRNVAIERHRVEARRSALLARELGRGQLDLPAESIGENDDSSRLHQLVVRQFAELTPRQREVFELVELRGGSIADVAAQLGIEASTVRVLLLRARRTIRMKMLEAHPDLLEGYRS